MRQLHRLLAVAVLTVGLAGCSTLLVSSHIERGLDFTRYDTFDWGPADSLPTGDPRLDRDPFFIDHLQGAIEKQMAAKGYARVESGPPDLLVHYHASTQRRLSLDAADRDRGDCLSDDCEAGVSEYEAGTLIVDIIDARTSQLVWRGWAQDSLEGVLGNRDRLAGTARKGIEGMFARLPAGR
jgi:hypothetical protein